MCHLCGLTLYPPYLSIPPVYQLHFQVVESKLCMQKGRGGKFTPRRCGWDLGVGNALQYMHANKHLRAAVGEFWADYEDGETFWGSPYARQLDSLTKGVLRQRAEQPCMASCACEEDSDDACVTCLERGCLSGVYKLGMLLVPLICHLVAIQRSVSLWQGSCMIYSASP